MARAVAAVLLLGLLRGRSAAEDLVVPARVQAELLKKLASYDRNFLERVGGKVAIAIVVRPSEVDSARASSQIEGAFKELALIAGLPHEEMIVPWSGARELAELCGKRRLAIIYLTPGFAGEIAAVAEQLVGKNVLTVASVLGYVAKGAVLGFELVSGRTKLVINLDQAKRQSVAFRADALALMRIVH